MLYVNMLHYLWIILTLSYCQLHSMEFQNSRVRRVKIRDKVNYEIILCSRKLLFVRRIRYLNIYSTLKNGDDEEVSRRLR
jgi:hypothetical protein